MLLIRKDGEFELSGSLEESRPVHFQHSAKGAKGTTALTKAGAL